MGTRDGVGGRRPCVVWHIPRASETERPLTEAEQMGKLTGDWGGSLVVHKLFGDNKKDKT